MNWYKIAKQNFPVWLAKELTNPSNYPLPPELNEPKNIEVIRQWIAETNPNLSDLNIINAWNKASEDNRLKSYRDPESIEQIQRNVNRFVSETQNVNPNNPDFAVDIRIKAKSPPPSKINKANKEIHQLGNYHTKIPIEQIFEILRKQNIVALQEDGKMWSGFLIGGSECGSTNAVNQRAAFRLAYPIDGFEYVPINKYLNISWCTMPSGKYEIVAYIG